MTVICRTIAAVALTAVSTFATAAPFCVVTSAGRQCFYMDEPTCERAAASARGACVINQSEVRAPANGAPFCVISSAGTQCSYYDAQQCENAARIARGSCAAK
jgi:hypothetical protein